MSPFVFLVVLDDMLSKAIDQSIRGIRWKFTSHLEDLNYADDICLISTKESDMQGKINDLVNESLVAGLQLNAAKTNALKINVSNTDNNFIAGDAVIENVDSFTYQAIISTYEGALDDVRCRVAKARTAFFQLSKVRNSASISKRTKIRLFNSNA